MLMGMHPIVVSHSTISDFSIEPRLCWHCSDFGGFDASGSHGRCAKPGEACVQASPAMGCAFWQREVGTDDEPGPPVGFLGLMPGTGWR